MTNQSLDQPKAALLPICYKRVGDLRKAGIICLFGPVCGHRTIFQNKHTPSLAFDNQIDFVHGFLVYHQFKTNA